MQPYDKKHPLRGMLENTCYALAFIAIPMITTAADPDARIVGGQAVSISAVPSTVAMISRKRLAESGNYTLSQFCGGTVIAPRWVLTAAHCVVQQGSVASPESMSIMMGSANLQQPVYQPIAVTRIIPHASYRTTEDGFDIALLQLQSDSLVAATAVDNQPVVLNDLAYIAGWGLLRAPNDSQSNLQPTALQGAYVSMIPGERCREFAPLVGSAVDGKQLCAGVPRGGIDTCQGDSGGPLYRVPAEGSAQGLSLVGITSWGIGCADAGNPGVYTLVSAFSDWIRQQTAETGVGTTTNQPAEQPTTQPGTQPDIPPTGQPGGDTLAATGPTSSTEAAATWLLLVLLAPLALLRSNRHRSLPCIGIIAMSGACMSAQELSAKNEDAMDVAVVSQPMGARRDAIISDISQQWRVEAACTIVKTGYGLNRRAYFLETCTFANPAAHTACGMLPESIEYRFFEDKLVQVAFEFNQAHPQSNLTINANKNYLHCLHAQLQQLALSPEPVKTSSDTSALMLRYQLQDKSIELQVDAALRTTVSEIESVSKIHLL